MLTVAVLQQRQSLCRKIGGCSDDGKLGTLFRIRGIIEQMTQSLSFANNSVKHPVIWADTTTSYPGETHMHTVQK